MQKKLNSWDERYSAPSFYYGTDPNDFLREHAREIPPGGRVLCLAEGEGRNAVFLAQLGYQVTAVDGSSVGLDKLRHLAQQKGVAVETIHADLNDYPIQPGTWDGIVSVWCHTPKDLRQRLHSQAIQGLKPEGVFLLEAYRPKQLEFKTGGPPTAELMMTLADLQRELAGLHLVIAQEIDREIQEGKGHVGMSAVVQILAKKNR